MEDFRRQLGYFKTTERAEGLSAAVERWKPATWIDELCGEAWNKMKSAQANGQLLDGYGVGGAGDVELDSSCSDNDGRENSTGHNEERFSEVEDKDAVAILPSTSDEELGYTDF